VRFNFIAALFVAVAAKMLVLFWRFLWRDFTFPQDEPSSPAHKSLKTRDFSARWG
jgi:hypothetical protein